MYSELYGRMHLKIGKFQGQHRCGRAGMGGMRLFFAQEFVAVHRFLDFIAALHGWFGVVASSTQLAVHTDVSVFAFVAF